MMFERFKTQTAAHRAGRPEANDGYDVDLRRRILGEEPVRDDMPEPQLPVRGSRSFAVSDTWSALRQITPGKRSVFMRLRRSCEEPIATGFDILRTEVLQALRAECWNRIGVAAPTSGCGTTFTALNLACGLSRIENLRTLLVDLNQRAPGLHKAFGVPWEGRIADLLSGEVHASQYACKYSDTLGLILNAEPNRAAADILHGATAADVLADTMLTLDPSVIVYDLPPVLEYDDLSAFAPNLDAVLLVADGSRSSPDEILAAEQKLAGQVPLLGVVLNRAERG